MNKHKQLITYSNKLCYQTVQIKYVGLLQSLSPRAPWFSTPFKIYWNPYQSKNQWSHELYPSNPSQTRSITPRRISSLLQAILKLLPSVETLNSFLGAKSRELETIAMDSWIVLSMNFQSKLDTNRRLCRKKKFHPIISARPETPPN